VIPEISFLAALTQRRIRTQSGENMNSCVLLLFCVLLPFLLASESTRTEIHSGVVNCRQYSHFMERWAKVFTTGVGIEDLLNEYFINSTKIHIIGPSVFTYTGIYFGIAGWNEFITKLTNADLPSSVEIWEQNICQIKSGHVVGYDTTVVYYNTSLIPDRNLGPVHTTERFEFTQRGKLASFTILADLYTGAAYLPISIINPPVDVTCPSS